MEFVLLKRESAEWNKAWDWLASHPINESIDNPSVALHHNEQWQYVGSYKQGDRVISQFRHRDHPNTGEVYTATYTHEPFDEKEIVKKFKV